MKAVNVLFFPVGEVPQLREVKCPELAELQALVGGQVQTVVLRPGLGLWCNEEGRLLGLAPNRVIPGLDLIHGPFFLAAEDDDGELLSIEPRDVTAILATIGLVPKRIVTSAGVVS
jgi:hypothetical protein